MRIVLFLLCFVSSAAQAETYHVRSELCQMLHKPEGVSGAGYVPGVDVRGKAVAPADLGGSALPLGVVHIPLEMDLVQRYDLDVPKGLELKPGLGVMSVYQDGRVLLDGRDISQEAGVYCAEKAVSVPKPERKENRQAVPVGVISNNDTGVEVEQAPAVPVDPSIIEGQSN